MIWKESTPHRHASLSNLANYLGIIQFHLFDLQVRISALFQENYATQQTRCCPQQIQLNNGPDPKTPQWWRTLHDCIISMCVRNMYQITPRSYTPREEEELVEERLDSWRETGKENRRLGMRMEGVEKEEDD
jgi:hypothetical protein